MSSTCAATSSREPSISRAVGAIGSKDHPQAKEQADYNLKYLIAVALLDDQVGPAQLRAGAHSGAGCAGAARAGGNPSR